MLLYVIYRRIEVHIRKSIYVYICSFTFKKYISSFMRLFVVICKMLLASLLDESQLALLHWVHIIKGNTIQINVTSK